MGVISDLLFQDSAEVAGTQRVEQVQQQDSQQIGGAILNTMKALLDSVETSALTALSQTEAGKKLQAEYVRTTAKTYWTQYGPAAFGFLLTAFLVIVFLGGKRV